MILFCSRNTVYVPVQIIDFIHDHIKSKFPLLTYILKPFFCHLITESNRYAVNLFLYKDNSECNNKFLPLDGRVGIHFCFLWVIFTHLGEFNGFIPKDLRETQALTCILLNPVSLCCSFKNAAKDGAAES